MCRLSPKNLPTFTLSLTCDQYSRLSNHKRQPKGKASSSRRERKVTRHSHMQSVQSLCWMRWKDIKKLASSKLEMKELGVQGKAQQKLTGDWQGY